MDALGDSFRTCWDGCLGFKTRKIYGFELSASVVEGDKGMHVLIFVLTSFRMHTTTGAGGWDIKRMESRRALQAAANRIEQYLRGSDVAMLHPGSSRVRRIKGCAVQAT